LKRCVLELGGHAPVLVFADADLDTAIEAIAAYKFECAGQSCNAPSRIFVERPVYSRFVEAFASRAASFRLGNGMNDLTQMGPLAHPRRVAAMKYLIDDAIGRGSQVVGGRGPVPGMGYF
jgi:succinate-semialdehyde dehydrogenase/glutarate-semialdehyde dehydrogenase